MTLYEFEGRKPEVDESSYVADSAEIIGDVKVGEDCFIAPGAKIKGDYGTIEIGDNSNVQENCVVHARPEEKTVIGDWVTVGHGAIIHGAEIDDHAVIGMGAILSDDARVKTWGVVGEGAVVRNGQEIPEENVAVGVPAKVIKQIDEDYKERWKEMKENYSSFSDRYEENLKKID